MSFKSSADCASLSAVDLMWVLLHPNTEALFAKFGITQLIAPRVIQTSPSIIVGGTEPQMVETPESTRVEQRIVTSKR